MPASNVLALDVGEKRVGLAMVRADVRVPITLPALDRQAADFWAQLLKVIKQQDIGRIVIGLPRSLEGLDTAQTKQTKTFAEELKGHTTLPIHWQDEALTSVKAAEILKTSGQPFEKADVDSLAASLILNDYLDTERTDS